MLTPNRHSKFETAAAAILVAVAVIASGCGGGGDTAQPPAAAPAQTAEPAQTPAPTPEPSPPPAEPTLAPEPSPAGVAAPTPAPASLEPAVVEGESDTPQVPVACGTAPIHGQPHELVAVDTDGDDIPDSCVPDHEHPHELPDFGPSTGSESPEPAIPATAEPGTGSGPRQDCERAGGAWDDATGECETGGGAGPVVEPTEEAMPDNVLPESWLRDPSCRNVWRWWNGQVWTAWVANAEVTSEDPLRDGENFGLPTSESLEPDCPPEGIHLDEYPFTAAELGCEGPVPACFINDNGLPQATRLISHQVLVDSGGYHSNLLHDHAPNVDEATTLSYLSDCLVHWPVYQESRYEMFQFTGTPIQTCSVVWRLMAYPINLLGAEGDLECVWDAFEGLYLFNRRIVSRYIRTGWAEKCGSWLDPHPDRAIDPECQLPDGYHYRMTREISADPRFADNNLSLDDPQFSEETVAQRWCGFLERCNDLWRQVAPNRWAYFNSAGWASPCIERISRWELPYALFGRCLHLRVLASLVRGEGEEGLPTVPAEPTDNNMWRTC